VEAATARGQDTRDRMVAATIELLMQGGYAAASVGAVTSGAGVAAGTLYRHFASKEELFAFVFRDVCSREEAAMRTAAESAGSATERLDAIVDVFARRALAHPRLAWALLAEPVDAMVDAERLAYRVRYRDLIAKVLEEGIAGNELAQSDTQVTASALVGAIGEAMVGPLAPTAGPAGDDALITQLQAIVRRAAGAMS
jgi:AcrR family transcriptional regulator